MNSNKMNHGFDFDVRIIIAVLWIARMLSGLQGDTMRLHDPAALKANLAGTAAVAVTGELLLIMSILFTVPILMSVLTLILKYPMNLWLNRVFGIFFAVFDLVFLVLALFMWHSAGYEIVWSIAYLVFTALIVRYAWTWRKTE